MVRIFRNYEELSKRQQIGVGVINTLIGIAIMFALNNSMGIRPEVTAVHVSVILVVGTVYLFCYSIIVRMRKNKVSRVP